MTSVLKYWSMVVDNGQQMVNGEWSWSINKDDVTIAEDRIARIQVNMGIDLLRTDSAINGNGQCCWMKWSWLMVNLGSLVFKNA